MSQTDAEAEQPSRAELARRVQALEARQEAMSKKFDALKDLLIADRELTDPAVEAHDDIMTVIEDHEEQVSEVGQKAALFDERSEQLDTEQRLVKIREYLVTTAEEKDVNIYKADYSEVRAVFGGEISDSWANQLIDKAAGTFPEDVNQAKEGFYVVRPNDGRKKIAVQTDKIEDRRFLRLKNSNTQEGP